MSKYLSSTQRNCLHSVLDSSLLVGDLPHHPLNTLPQDIPFYIVKFSDVPERIRRSGRQEKEDSVLRETGRCLELQCG